ncbi:GHKL domain-containing protein [Clostridium sp. AF15-17LB]|nr:GHKL domain-containing protein [Clostridium sp. AF15-17LB]
MTPDNIISALLFITPCILVLCLTFFDHLRTPNRATAAVSITVFLLIDIASTYIYYSRPLTVWTMILLSFAAMLSGVALFRAASGYSFAQSLFTVAIVMCYTDSIYVCSSQIHYFVTGRLPGSTPVLRALSTLAVALPTFPFILMLFKRLLRTALDETEHLAFWRISWGIPMCNRMLYYLAIFPIFSKRLPATDASDIYFTPILWIILTFFTYTIALKMVVEATKNAKLEEDLHISETQFAAQQKQSEMLQQRIEETMRIRHDFRHTLIALQACLDADDYDGMGEFISNYICSLDSLRPTSYCGNPVINALVSYYAELSRDNGISFSPSIQLDRDLPFSDTDTCIVLGNLLENAVEACQRQAQEDRYIRLKLHAVNDCTLVIIVENSYNGIVRRRDNAFLSTKARGRKGIGIVSILDVVSKYNGIPQFKYDGHAFKASIVLSCGSTAKKTSPP